MSALLFEISPLDPLTYVSVPLLLLLAAALASYLPARRVTGLLCGNCTSSWPGKCSRA